MQLTKKNNHKIFKKKNILIIGELIIDKSYKVINIGKSLETNNPKYFIESTKKEMGGAGMVYKSVKKIISKNPIFITSKHYKSKFFEDKNIQFFNSNVSDIIKSRYWENKKKIFQLNQDYKKKYHDKKYFNKFAIKEIKKIINNIESIIISDYNHNLISKEIIIEIKKMCNKKKIEVFVDKQIRNFNEFPKYYKNLDYLMINEFEFKLLKNKFDVKGGTINSLKNLKNKLKFKNIVLKKGKKGSCMIDENNDYFHVKSNFSKVVYDVAGAGDHFLAMFASLNKSISPQKKLLYSNKWAGYNLK